MNECTPPPAKSRNKKNRRYYLHRRLKRFVSIDAHKRLIMFREDIFDEMNVTQLAYFIELQRKYNYTAQYQL